MSDYIPKIDLVLQRAFDPKKECVICGKRGDASKLVSTPNGRDKVEKAAEILREDTVTHHIHKAKSEGCNFMYHMDNDCYKSFTLKRKIDAALKKRKREELQAIMESSQREETEDITESTSGSVTTRSKASSSRNLMSSVDVTKRDITHKISCGICGKVTHNGVRDKHRLCERPRAIKFFSALKFLQDETSLKFADIADVEGLIASDVYCHRTCMLNYLQKYDFEIAVCILCHQNYRRRGLFSNLSIDNLIIVLDKARKDGDAETVNAILEVFNEANQELSETCYAHDECLNNYLSEESADTFQCYVNHVVPLVNDMLSKKYGLELSAINEYISEKVPGRKFYNHHIKSFIAKSFEEEVSFCDPYRKYESEIVFPSSISQSEIVQMIQTHDSIAYAGKVIREALLKVDFGLQDSFCDKADLHNAYYGTEMPSVLTTFFSSLFKIPKAKLLTEKHNFDGTSDIDEDEEMDEDPISDFVSSGCRYNKKILKMDSLFQKMYYIVHNGRKISPLQVMTGHTIYDKFKSREFITSLNNLGDSISYSEVKRHRSNLGAYEIERSEERSCHMPSHFNDVDFTSGAFDNFNHQDRSSITAPKDSNDTALLLFQNKCSPSPPRGKVSDLKTSIRGRKYIKELDFQKIKPYRYDRKKIMPLPKDFKSSQFGYEPGEKHKIINLARTADFENEWFELCPTWSGSFSLISRKSKALTCKKVGLLPFIQNPITEIETVYTCLLNFKKIAAHLQQKVLPIYCDEGVYHLTTKIYLNNPEMFNDIFIMLGSFHTAKTALRCVGKFVRGSGAEDAFIESGLFGPKSVETVLGGSHYYRSFNGLLMLSEAIERLKFKAFWAAADKDLYSEAVEEFLSFQKSLGQMNSIKSYHKLEELLQSENFKHLLEALGQFSQITEAKSAQCKFWNEFLRLMNIVKNLVRADREGDFLLHMQSMQDLLPVFTGCGAVNYQRYATFYLEQLKNLKSKMPELYASFLKGDFVVKRKEGSFNAVAGDMALEQTIMRGGKGSGGIIGNTKSLAYVSEWALVSPEVLSISNTFRSITRADKSGNNECGVHHQLRKSTISKVNNSVTKLTLFIESRSNPFIINENDLLLKNFVSEVISAESVADSRVKFQEWTEKAFREYHRQLYIEQSTNIMDRIPRVTLEPVDFIAEKKLSETDIKSKFSNKFQKTAMKTLLIAKEKKGDVKTILKYDVTTYSYLYDRDFHTKPTKSEMVDEIKKMVFEQNADLSSKPILNAHGLVVIDFMSFIRSQVVSKEDNSDSRQSFGKLIESLFFRMTSSHSHSQSTSYHIIFDSYIEGSIKGPERKRRMGGGGLRLAAVREETPLPRQMDKFWNSISNKILLQDLAKVKLSDLAKRHDVSIVMSGQVVESNTELHQTNAIYAHPGHFEIPELASDLDEADMRIIPHIKWHLENFDHCSEVLVESNDTDVVILLLFYFQKFALFGLEKLWIHYGKGKTAAYIPVHDIFQKLGPDFCRCLLKSHIGTGCDYLSKIGSKRSALAAEPSKNLTTFGEGVSLTEAQIDEAETYLAHAYQGVRALKAVKKSPQLIATSKDKTFDDLRHTEFNKNVSVLLLPPTSHAIRNAHARRWFFLFKKMSSLLDQFWDSSSYDPLEYGWKLVDSELYPVKGLNLLPDKFCTTCACKTGCQTGRCKCRKTDALCTDFCKCLSCTNTR